MVFGDVADTFARDCHDARPFLGDLDMRAMEFGDGGRQRQAKAMAWQKQMGFE